MRSVEWSFPSALLVIGPGASGRRLVAAARGRSCGRDDCRRPLIGLLLEALDEEPQGECYLEEEPGGCEGEADTDPEHLGDGAGDEARIPDEAGDGEPSRDQPGPEQEQAEECGPD